MRDAATACVNLIFWTSINVPPVRARFYDAAKCAASDASSFAIKAEIIPRCMRIGQPWNAEYVVVIKFALK